MTYYNEYMYAIDNFPDLYRNEQKTQNRHKNIFSAMLYVTEYSISYEPRTNSMINRASNYHCKISGLIRQQRHRTTYINFFIILCRIMHHENNTFNTNK